MEEYGIMEDFNADKKEMRVVWKVYLEWLSYTCTPHHLPSKEYKVINCTNYKPTKVKPILEYAWSPHLQVARCLCYRKSTMHCSMICIVNEETMFTAMLNSLGLLLNHTTPTLN